MLQAPSHGQSGCHGIAALAARLFLPSTCTCCCKLGSTASPGTARDNPAVGVPAVLGACRGLTLGVWRGLLPSFSKAEHPEPLGVVEG